MVRKSWLYRGKEYARVEVNSSYDNLGYSTRGGSGFRRDVAERRDSAWSLECGCARARYRRGGGGSEEQAIGIVGLDSGTGTGDVFRRVSVASAPVNRQDANGDPSNCESRCRRPPTNVASQPR